MDEFGPEGELTVDVDAVLRELLPFSPLMLPIAC
jgi:hypothetical protein